MVKHQARFHEPAKSLLFAILQEFLGVAQDKLCG
jgi:hypothetical protein